MTQAQQDLYDLLLPPVDLLPVIANVVGGNPAWRRWLDRIEEVYIGRKPHIIGSLSDEELAQCFEAVDMADLWVATR